MQKYGSSYGALYKTMKANRPLNGFRWRFIKECEADLKLILNVK